MNTCHICDRTALNGPKPHSIRMPQTAFNEKLAYIESVCDVLLESRFGPVYSYSYLERPDYNAADAPVSFLGLIEDECAPWYASEYFRTAKRQNRLRQRSASTRLSFNIPKPLDRGANTQQTLGISATPRCFPPTLGRGSPTSDGRTPSLAPPLRS